MVTRSLPARNRCVEVAREASISRLSTLPTTLPGRLYLFCTSFGHSSLTVSCLVVHLSAINGFQGRESEERSFSNIAGGALFVAKVADCDSPQDVSFRAFQRMPLHLCGSLYTRNISSTRATPTPVCEGSPKIHVHVLADFQRNRNIRFHQTQE